MQFYQKSRSSRLLSPLLCVVLGVLLLLWPGVSLLTVCYLLGGLLIVFGLWQTVRSAVYGLAYWGALMLSIGVLSLFLGAGIVLFPRVVSSLLPIMLGIGLLIDGVTRLSFALRFRQLYGRRRAAVLLFALLTVAAGVLLLLRPFGGAVAFTMVTGAFLLITGIANLVGWYAER